MQAQQAEKIIRVSNSVAAGTTAINCAGVNMSGWESVEFIAFFGTLTTTHVTKLKAQQSSDDAAADAYDDLAGSATNQVGDTDSNKTARLEVVKPTKQWVRPVVVRGTANAVVDGVFAILRRGHNQAITQDASVSVYKSIISPAEGTA